MAVSLTAICSVETDLEFVEAALQAGAIAYVFKARIQKELVLAAKFRSPAKGFCIRGSGMNGSPELTFASHRINRISAAND